jgi:uncharacterized phage-like protein YoqJ
MKVGYKTEVDLKNEKSSIENVSKNNLTVLEDTSNTSNKYVVWHIEGGLGKNIAATALISPLKEKYNDRKLILVVSYPEVFLNHPDIHRVYRVGMVSYFYDDYIKGKDTIVFRHEPYFQSDHIMKKKHLIENWADLLGFHYNGTQPILYPNMIQNDFIYSWKRDKPVMVLHTNGGSMEQSTLYSWTRDMPYAIANAIVNRYSKDYHIIQIGRDKGHSVNGVEFIDIRMSNYELFSVLPLSKKRVLIDSSLQHAAAAMQLKSTVLWVGTSPNNFGYELHDNIVANTPKGNVKMVDSYLYDYSFEGINHECPYMDVNEMFNINDIFKSIDRQ